MCALVAGVQTCALPICWKETLDALEGPVRPEIVEALRAAHRRGARLISVCSGAYVLAATGLLDGKRATTHWRYIEAFRRRFPNVEWDPDVLYIDEGQVITSAGSAAGLDACLHLVRRDFGAAIRSEEHTSELQSLMRLSYAVFCLKKKN